MNGLLLDEIAIKIHAANAFTMIVNDCELRISVAGKNIHIASDRRLVATIPTAYSSNNHLEIEVTE